MDVSHTELITDADSLLWKSAVLLQESYIVVKHVNHADWEKEFKGVTGFYGRKRSRDGGWLAEQNADREDGDKLKYTDFTIEQRHRVVQDNNIGYNMIKNKINKLLNVTGCKDYKIVLGGQGNFREAEACIQEYKADRPDKPVQYYELKDWILQRYGDRVIMVDGIEADDVVSSYAHESYLQYISTGVHKYTLSYIDKDLDMCMCPRINYDKLDGGVYDPTPYECAFSFCKQMLMGDSVDNIQGLPKLPADMLLEYDIKNSSGLGETTAKALLENAETIQQLFQLVVDAYKGYYTTEEFEFTSWRGDVSTRTWFDMLNENCQLLYMRRYHDVPFDLKGTLDNLEVVI